MVFLLPGYDFTRPICHGLQCFEYSKIIVSDKLTLNLENEMYVVMEIQIINRFVSRNTLSYSEVKD